MRRSEKIVAVYFISMLMVAEIFYMQDNRSLRYAYSDDVKHVKDVSMDPKGDSYSLNFRSKDRSPIEAINFNSFVPETLMCKSNSVVSFEIETKNISGLNTSPKWRPPLNGLPYAICYAWRSLDNESKTSGAWQYKTECSTTHAMNTVSIFVDPHDLFDFENGIYTFGLTHLLQDQRSFSVPWWLMEANWKQKGRSWQRPVHFQYLDAQGKLLFESDAGVRIHGNATRGFPQKSLRLNADKRYGNKNFELPFFETNKYKKYHSIILRNSGNDWGRTMCADGFIQSRLNGLEIDKQSYKPVVVFINGVYWGIHALNERMDEYYFAQKYNVKKKEVTLIEGSELAYGEEKLRQEFLQIVEFCKANSLKDRSKYNYICSKFNMPNLALYSAIEIYCANRDWPKQNVQLVKIKGHNENKWFCSVRDLDCSYSYYGSDSYSFDMFNYLFQSNDPFAIVFTALMKNHDFRLKVREKLIFLMQGNFSIERQIKDYDILTKVINKEIDQHIKRWRKPLDKETWQRNVEEFKSFIRKRQSSLEKQMNKYLN